MDFLVWTGMPLIVVVLLSARHLAQFALGDEDARSMGHNTRLMASFFMLLAVALLAPVVATAGPFAFFGLMSAYFARRLVGDRPAEVMLCSALLLWAETLGRSLFYPVIVTAGILVSVVGVPAFLVVARLNRGRV